MDIVNESVFNKVGQTDYVKDGVLHSCRTAPSVMVTSEEDLNNLPGIYSPGTVAHTVGYTQMWQLGSDGTWTPMTTVRDAIEQQTGYLAVLAEEKRDELYEDISTIARLVRSGTVESNKKLFPIGDQIIIPWKDMDDEDHDTDETAYQVPWDIVHHGMVTLEDGRTVPGMFLQAHKSLPAYSVEFDGVQAAMIVEETITAGDYYMSFIGTPLGDVDVSVTIENDIAPGSAVIISLSPVGFFNFLFNVYESEDDEEPVASYSISLGEKRGNPFTAKVNFYENAIDGYSRWSQSAIRQYLNKSGANWFEKKGYYGWRPYYYDKKGFISGLDSDFLNAIKPVKNDTVAISWDENNNLVVETDTTFDKFFLPSLEQMNIQPFYPGVEGKTFEYWKQALGTQKFVDNNASKEWDDDREQYDAFKIKRVDTDDLESIYLRSVYDFPLGREAFAALSAGVISLRGYSMQGFAASNEGNVTPVCVIC